MEMGNFYGLMVPCIKEILTKISLKVKEPLFGQVKSHM